MTSGAESNAELDRAFRQEASALLETIEAALFKILDRKTPDLVHTLVRSIHTLRGSAANLGQKTLAKIAGRLEDILETLYAPDLELDSELGMLLLAGYESLRSPLLAFLYEGEFDATDALAQNNTVYEQLRTKLGDFLKREVVLPGSAELGFDLVGTIFTETVPHDLHELETTLNAKDPQQITTVLRSQAGFFSDLAATSELPGLASIATAIQLALDHAPSESFKIGIAALANLHQARRDVLQGDRTLGGTVSPNLRQWVPADAQHVLEPPVLEPQEPPPNAPVTPESVTPDLIEPEPDLAAAAAVPELAVNERDAMTAVAAFTGEVGDAPTDEALTDEDLDEVPVDWWLAEAIAAPDLGADESTTELDPLWLAQDATDVATDTEAELGAELGTEPGAESDWQSRTALDAFATEAFTAEDFTDPDPLDATFGLENLETAVGFTDTASVPEDLSLTPTAQAEPDPELQQAFLAEAADMLESLENALFKLLDAKEIETVHTLMGSAHTIKGSASSLGQHAIATIAHNLEDVFQCFYAPELDLDPELSTLLLNGYECLREPLQALIAERPLADAEALERAAPVFERLKQTLGDFYGRELVLPSSADLGFDLVGTIFAESVPSDLQALEAALGSEDSSHVAAVLRLQIDLFKGLAATSELPGLERIATTIEAALAQQPNQALAIGQAALANLQQAQSAILAGDRTIGGVVSPGLQRFLTATEGADPSDDCSTELLAFADVSDALATTEPALDPQTTGPLDPFQEWDSDPTDTVDVTTWAATAPVDAALAGDALTEDVLADASLAAETLAADGFSQDWPETWLEPDVMAADVEESSSELPMLTPPAVVESAPTAPPDPSVSALASSAQPATQPVESQLLAAFAPSQPFATTVPDVLGPQRFDPSALDQVLQSLWMGEPELRHSAATSQTPEVITPPPLPQQTGGNTVRVATEQLERLSQSLAELLISENQQDLQSDQAFRTTQETLQRFRSCQQQLARVQDWANRHLLLGKRVQLQRLATATVGSGHSSLHQIPKSSSTLFTTAFATNTGLIGPGVLDSGGNAGGNGTDFQDVNAQDWAFDDLEMDAYSDLHLMLQTFQDTLAGLGQSIEQVEGILQQSRLGLSKRKQLLSTTQDELLQAQMLPLDTVLNRLPRLLQQLIASHQKPAQLRLLGAEVLVDKAILEKLYEPLLHLMRNAYDHGLESPQQRRQSGKPEVGTIQVRASHQGSRTLIEVQDDGGGLNWGRIRQKALQKQLITPQAASHLSPADLADLIFTPGFSTSEQVGDLSGRGIGLDVVRNQIQALKGNITVRSRPGQGTIFSLQLPLKVTTARLLVCQSGGRIYALPSDAIGQVLHPRPEQLAEQVAPHGSTAPQTAQHYLRWQTETGACLVPVRPLEHLIQYACPWLLQEQLTQERDLALSAFPLQQRERVKPLLMLQVAQQQLCLQVDQILVEQELVIKSLGSLVALPNYVQGYTVLGDSSLCLVIEPLAVIQQQPRLGEAQALAQRPGLTGDEIPTALLPQRADSSSGAETARLATPVTQAPVSPPHRRQRQSLQVLVVEDSVVQRQSLARTLSQAGHQVVEARDGQDAIAQLHKHNTVDVVLCDIEMPLMNGFEFLSHCRQDADLVQFPVAMLTTRSGQKHRQTAKLLGAKAYITKPYSEPDLLNTISQLAQLKATRPDP
ncbi:MAG: Hpt domain-containing protein [Cyanobacteria bacterium P01_H01_bin.121]